MDEDAVCPLCCEELDISDRQFFPCKCGYQVCMWCWHRIRESESGLCPACRTPYGDDPHEFSAVDVEEVLKANKEKEAAAKRERERQRHEQTSGMSSEVEGLAGGRSSGQMDIPKDRTQLANMRVIRRNLVYAVGLPPEIATEEKLKRPEYFGQYGKIAKIVLNRNQITPGTDIRRGSASAYVTFVHKEDTLACILALDGFYMDGRNIRASYGTSKYCSAFIKNVRCNNPECTYLHQMGDIEDTFTKQEIQAGYVTSGRDVLARQQQIVQQALSAANGAAGSTPRRRTGGGGPTGTGKASSNPVFPPPSFDEPVKPTSANLVPPPTSVAAKQRSASVASGTSAFPTISAAAPVAGSQIAALPLSRSASTGAVPSNDTNSPGSGTKVSVASSAPSASRNNTVDPASAAVSASNPLAPSGATAASVVAGMHSLNGHSDPPPAHTTLTPLTPLKRTVVKGAKAPGAAGSNAAESTKLPNVRTGAPKNKPNGLKTAIQPSSSSSSDAGSSSSLNALPARVEGVSSIGGDVIAAPTAVAPPIGKVRGPINGMTYISTHVPTTLTGLDGLGGLGGEVFDGPLHSSSSNSRSAIGAGKDKWSSQSFPGSDSGYPLNQAGMWGNSGGSFGSHSPQNHASSGNDAIGGGIIGGGTFGGSGSSALASMLGINLPTGSGSLRESTNLWMSSVPLPQQAPISALNGNPVPAQGIIGGSAHPNNRNGFVGGVAIGGNNRQPVDSFGNGGSSSDIALLQSLLPGVHITSGVTAGGFRSTGAGNDWNNAPGPQSRGHGGNPSLAPGNPHQSFNIQSSFGGQPIAQSNQKQRHAPGSIW